MSKEKQIEEMAKVIQQGELDRNRGDLDCTEFTTDVVIKVGLQRLAGAKALYNAGYRKQKKGSWNVIKPSRENGKPSYICSVCGALYHEDVREWTGCPKCLSEMKRVINQR